MLMWEENLSFYLLFTHKPCPFIRILTFFGANLELRVMFCEAAPRKFSTQVEVFCILIVYLSSCAASFTSNNEK